MRIVGLTGGIASGKSTVSDLFRSSGLPVVDADVIARERNQWVEKVVAAFGEEILHASGEVDRAHLGQIVFSDSEKRQLLNRLLAPHISSGITWEVARLWLKGFDVIVLDIPLLFEVKMDRWTKPIVVVWRDDTSEEQARNRVNAQAPLDWKREKADVVIDNSGSLEDTRLRFQEVLALVTRPLTWKEFLRSRKGLTLILISSVAAALASLR
ncbi:unnamed protein product [Spirodela intermedia]|uniref:Uncharacterized protein n=1 Tax=Spirodela intermedia TaxID=51605 RepID=A0A7I8I9Z0_SPIIN|nr:unnamed protein product [Spirodela intermedia]CAA6654264.1 unnamed protein product [Spirodela intermedia]